MAQEARSSVMCVNVGMLTGQERKRQSRVVAKSGRIHWAVDSTSVGTEDRTGHITRQVSKQIVVDRYSQSGRSDSRLGWAGLGT